MIISFDRSPADFYKLARIALDNGDIKRAAAYCEKAISGKGTMEYKLTLADIYLRMGRFSSAMDVALDVICNERGGKSEAYDIMSRATGATGKLFEMVYYITRKARLDGDTAALDAMDEMMDEMASGLTEAPKQHLFLVGKEPEKDYSAAMDRAVFYMRTEEYEKAIAEVSEISETSKYYDEALDILLRCTLKLSDTEEVCRLAKKAVERDPKNAFVLYVLVTVCKKEEYLSSLADVTDDASSLYYAVAAADAQKEYALATSLAERLIACSVYSSEVYFVAAGVYHNAGMREKCANTLKELFSLYKKYPANVILNGLKGRKHYDVMFSGVMPEFISDILRRYVRKHAHTPDDFVHSMLTDADFRACVYVLYEAGDEEVIQNTISFMGQKHIKEIERFFESMLLKTKIDSMTKRDILAELLLNKHKGHLTLVSTAIPLRVPCAKPENYEKYPFALKEAYVDAYSFGMCVMDVPSAKRIAVHTERFYAEEEVWRNMHARELTAALICLSLPPAAPQFAFSVAEDACSYVCRQILCLRKKEIAKVGRLVAYFERMK